MAALRGPVDAISFSRGKRPMTDRGSGVRSRMTQNTSNGRETLDNFVEIGQMVIENGDHGAPGERRPVGHLQRRVLIII